MDNVETLEATEKTGAKGTNQSGIRAHNERLVLSLLRRQGPLAKAAVARATGLSAQTATNIMRALEADGLILRGEPKRGKVGQPSVPMGLARDGAYFWGLKIGRRSTDLVLTNFLGQITARAHRTHPYPTPADTLRFVQDHTAKMTGPMPSQQQERIAGLGIAMPSQIWRWEKSINVAPGAMDAWKDFDVLSRFEEVCDCPVFLQNDATAACGAELVFGDGDHPRNFLYIYLGYFIGGGMVLNDALYAGPTGNAGGIGPLPVIGPDGEMTQLLEIASLSSLERDLIETGGDPNLLWGSVESWDIAPELLDRWVARTSDSVAQAIVAALSIIDFEAILIDGWMPTDLRRRLVNATIACFEAKNRRGLNEPILREGTIGADARALGAASLPLSHRFLLGDGLPR